MGGAGEAEATLVCREPKLIACIMWLDFTFDLCSIAASHLLGVSLLPPGDQNAGRGGVTVALSRTSDTSF